ncbi:hypothetical protein MC885_021413 [Smutsia gigantea]|nr:hypothetical protein MC885_021413 [Smutsia gigantea]
MWLCPVLGLQAGAALLAPLGTSDGPHSLRCNLTVLSQDGSVQLRFVTQAYSNGQPFLHWERQGQAVGAVGLGAETWDPETKVLTEMGKDLRMVLADTMALQILKGGPHSLQEVWGCEIQPGSSSRGFRHFYYDEGPFLSYHLKTRGHWLRKSRGPGTQMVFKARTSGPTCKESFVLACGDICAPGWAFLGENGTCEATSPVLTPGGANRPSSPFLESSITFKPALHKLSVLGLVLSILHPSHCDFCSAVVLS